MITLNAPRYISISPLIPREKMPKKKKKHPFSEKNFLIHKTVLDAQRRRPLPPRSSIMPCFLPPVAVLSLVFVHLQKKNQKKTSMYKPKHRPGSKPPPGMFDCIPVRIVFLLSASLLKSGRNIYIGPSPWSW